MAAFFCPLGGRCREIHLYLETFGRWVPLNVVHFVVFLFYMLVQRAKKVVSDSLGLVDFAIGLEIFVFNLPNGQVLFWGEIQITEGL